MYVIVEIQVRVVLPVERAEAPQRAVGHTVRKRFAKLGGRTVGLAKLGHELPLVYARGELEQTDTGHVHWRFAGFQMQEP